MSHYQNKQNQTNPFGSEIISSTWIMAAENIFLHGMKNPKICEFHVIYLYFLLNTPKIFEISSSKFYFSWDAMTLIRTFCSHGLG